MPLQERPRPYPLIDADPHAGRVVRYMRSSDYAVWGGATVAGPALLYLYEKVDPTKYRFGISPALRLTGFLGFCAGFMLAYQNSSLRFMGLTENAREAALDAQELGARAKRGEPIYGETDLSDYIQGVAARNSTWSQLKLSAMPWFNLVNHNRHGVDTSKYGESSNQPS
ncbi:hypothetical protein EHS25_003815 [Saitozyma podzolica]|uniref:NADH-ubiquinone oxidoreductase 21 kDa subunit n=1 Tax=Saitozyma podzolica TaxID=1890683 RepID=A0A427Y3L4_9TREE|nr:hypothetical protein EHS25_003815 [Saitozyma podzolica]